MTEKGPDGGKRPVGEEDRLAKKTGRCSPPVYRGRGPRSGEGVQKQRYENLSKWGYILIFDCGEVVKNTHSMQTTHYTLLLHPLTAKRSPPPINRGRAPSGLFSPSGYLSPCGLFHSNFLLRMYSLYNIYTKKGSPCGLPLCL